MQNPQNVLFYNLYLHADTESLNLCHPEILFVLDFTNGTTNNLHHLLLPHLSICILVTAVEVQVHLGPTDIKQLKIAEVQFYKPHTDNSEHHENSHTISHCKLRLDL